MTDGLDAGDVDVTTTRQIITVAVNCQNRRTNCL